MPITPDGWLDWATRIPGPADKKYTEPNACQGYVPHSAVGYYAGWASRLFSPERDPATGRYTSYAAASVHLWVAYDGSVKQHYPFTASCWASGSRYPNTHFVAAETEGGAPGQESEPLREAQIGAHVRIIHELSAWKGWTPMRPAYPIDVTATLYEHKECGLWGSAPTACPSSRIPWAEILSRLGAIMSDQEKKELAVRRAQDVMIAELLAGNWQSVTNRLAYFAVRPTV